MAKGGVEKLLMLVKRYWYVLLAGILLFIVSITASLFIYARFEGHPQETYWFELAGFLMDVGQTVLGTVLIGGGLGGVFNFIIEEQKKEEDAAKKRLETWRENWEKRKKFRQEIKNRLQEVHDNVALARVLIKSHRSGRTYGEQIRNRIMPSQIALNDIKRQLSEMKDESLITHLAELQVSLTFMSAYLSVLVEEFAQHYLDIANLQNYQDALMNRMHTVFTDVIQQTDEPEADTNANVTFLENIDNHLEQESVPDRIEAVWAAMERLDYVWDFIDDLRNEKGKASMFQTFYLDHHFHCFRMLRLKDSKTNKKICSRSDFKGYIHEQERLSAKKDSDQPITKNDSLTRMIMVEGLKFDFEKMEMVK